MPVTVLFCGLYAAKLGWCYTCWSQLLSTNQGTDCHLMSLFCSMILPICLIVFLSMNLVLYSALKEQGCLPSLNN